MHINVVVVVSWFILNINSFNNDKILKLENNCYSKN